MQARSQRPITPLLLATVGITGFLTAGLVGLCAVLHLLSSLGGTHHLWLGLAFALVSTVVFGSVFLVYVHWLRFGGGRDGRTPKRPNRVAACYSALGLAYVVLDCIAVASLLWFAPEPDQEFSAESWHAVDARQGMDGDRSPRQRMVRDLLAEHVTIGMTLEQAVELLGEPDYEWNRSVYYVLGLEPGIGGYYGPDREWLGLHFDWRGVLQDTDLVRD